MSKKQKRRSFNFSKINGFIITICFIGSFFSFIYLFTTSEKVDQTKRWCPSHNTFHDINENIADEVWCNNCKTWHAPNDESRTPIIK